MAVLGTMVIATASLSGSRHGRAHDWYPWECCSGLDCAPVLQVEVLPEAGLRVTTRHGTALVPASLERRESPDGRMHACMRPDDAGAMLPICLFVPPGQ
jgi:hypothetical protein